MAIHLIKEIQMAENPSHNIYLLINAKITWFLINGAVVVENGKREVVESRLKNTYKCINKKKSIMLSPLKACQYKA